MAGSIQKGLGANLVGMFDRLAPEYTGPRDPEAMALIGEEVAYGVIEEQVVPAEALSAATEELRAYHE